MRKRIILFIIGSLLLSSFVLTPLPVTGVAEEHKTSSIQSSRIPVLNNSSGIKDHDEILSVEFHGSISYKVASQPPGNNSFVSNEHQTLTRFQLADQYGTIGLLAHNTHAGAVFNELQIGDTIKLQYKQQKSVRYRIQSFRKFQAQNPNSPYSALIDLEDGTRYSASELFMNIYGAGHQLVLQTCLSKNGLKNWGRLFVIAEEIPPQPQVNYIPTPDELHYIWPRTGSLFSSVLSQ